MSSLSSVFQHHHSEAEQVAEHLPQASEPHEPQLALGHGKEPLWIYRALAGQEGPKSGNGFLNPSNNSNGEAFGLFVALPSGGELVALPN